MNEIYNKLNNSFKKNLVFHVGWRAGFFSEYNNMILAMLFCLQNKIKFILYSNDAAFKYKKGWEDYFLPFCERTSNPIHRYLNMREHSNPSDIKDFRTFKWFIKTNFFFMMAKLSKPFVSFDYYTQDVWINIRNLDKNATYDIPDLGIYGDLQDACRILVNLTWNYNAHTKNAIDALVSSIQLPDSYLGFHIRSGDKTTEADLVDACEYVHKAKSLSDLRNMFVLTDNYQIIEDLQKEYKEFNVYTLCETNERGYFHEVFKRQSKTIIRKSHEKLFASIELLNKAQLFIGTFSSNPGMFLGMRMPKNKVIGIDFDRWQLW